MFVLTYMGVSSLFSFPWQSAVAGPLAGLLIGLLWPHDQRQQPTTSVSCAIAAKSAPLSLTIVVLASLFALYFLRMAWVNVSVPSTLAEAGPLAAEKQLLAIDYRYYALIGAVQASRGEYEKALMSLKYAERGYRDVLLWNNLGNVLSRLGRWGEATQVYEDWVASGLDHANALSNLSVAYEQRGKIASAAETLRQKVELWPLASLEEIKRLVVVQMRSGAYQAAQQTLTTYRACWSQSDARTVAEMLNIEGSIAVATGLHDHAIQCFQQALNLYPELESAQRNLKNLRPSLM